MSSAEVAHRARVAVADAVDRVFTRAHWPCPASVLTHQAPRLADACFALDVLRNEMPSRFFAGTQDAATATWIRTELPELHRAVLASADALLDGRFDLLGYRGLQFGAPIDWHLDPVSRRRAPLVHWTAIDPLASEAVGDTKVIWELNRLQWVTQLAHAYALSGRERYASGAVQAVDAWIDANPPRHGINWTSSLEAAYRLMSWSWTLLLLRNSSALTGAWLTKVLAAVWEHAHYVRTHLSHYFSPNTHLTGEALGLFYAGTLFTEFADASDWRELGQDVLTSQIDKQFATDGVHFEQSTCYHAYTADTYLHFVVLANRGGIRLPPRVSEYVSRMVDFLLAVQRPDRSIPAIGDDDGGELLLLAPRNHRDAATTFSVAAGVFGRADFAWAAGGARAETAWVIGVETATATQAAASPPAEAPSRAFIDGGYAVMRSGWTRDAHHLLADIGPLGCPVSSGHGHADLLSVQCAVFGDTCLVDAGTCCYTAEPTWRDFFRSSTAHSTVVIDHASQAEPAGTFAWRRHPRATLRSWHSSDIVDYLDAEHDGYQRLAPPVLHRRRVVFVKPHYWVVIDDIDGGREHDVEVGFQFAPLTVSVEDDIWVCAHTARGHELWVAAVANLPLEVRVACGDVVPPRGWVSPEYGQRTPAPMLLYSARAVMPFRAMTLLLPASGGRRPPRIDAIRGEYGMPTGLVFDNELPRLAISDRALTVGALQLTIPQV